MSKQPEAIKELKPCPFCGKEVAFQKTSTDAGHPYYHIGCHHIDCPSVGFNTRLEFSSLSSEGVIKQWNTRHTPVDIEGLIDKYKKEKKECGDFSGTHYSIIIGDLEELMETQKLLDIEGLMPSEEEYEKIRSEAQVMSNVKGSPEGIKLAMRKVIDLLTSKLSERGTVEQNENLCPVCDTPLKSTNDPDTIVCKKCSLKG